jgi:cytochrome b
VWSVIGRLTHWFIVLLFVSCYVTSFYEHLLTAHIAIGVSLFFMLILKIVWGVIGPRYARWSDFNFNLAALKFYFVEKVQNRYREIPAGHNPASSWFAFLLTWVAILCCIIGFLLYGIQEAQGIFSSLNAHYYEYMNELDWFHIILAYITIIMIVTHVTGVLIEQFYHKTNMVMAMVTGYKQAKGENIKTTLKMKVLGSLYIAFAGLIGIYVYSVDSNIITQSEFCSIDYKKEHADFYMECSDCHNLIPPHLLPQKSWIRLMNETAEHYDEDLELEKDQIISITQYLVENSAEHSTQEAAYKFLKDVKNSGNFTLTKTDYWIKTHQHIPKEVFKSDEVEAKSNCVACHDKFEEAWLNDEQIKYDITP